MPSVSKRRLRKLARILVRPPERPSSGAQKMNQILGEDSILSRRSPVPRQFRTVVNWGNSSPLVGNHVNRIINRPEAIAVAVNKLSALSAMQAAGVRVPAFSTGKPADRRGMWLARHSLTGSGGAGIQVVRKDNEMPTAPLYVKYVPKTTEFRIHVAFGEAVLCQYKLRKNEAEQTPDQKLIRNHDNGWVFAPRPLEDLDLTVKQEAIKAVAALGLDFGAVDMIVGKADNLPYVLEVNTAPGMESPTLMEAYADVFRRNLL